MGFKNTDDIWKELDRINKNIKLAFNIQDGDVESRASETASSTTVSLKSKSMERDVIEAGSDIKFTIDSVSDNGTIVEGVIEFVLLNNG